MSCIVRARTGMEVLSFIGDVLVQRIIVNLQKCYRRRVMMHTCITTK